MGNLALQSAEKPDNLRATTGTVEVPTERDNDAALALGARPIQQHEPAARHTNNDNLFDKVDARFLGRMQNPAQCLYPILVAVVTLNHISTSSETESIFVPVHAVLRN